MRMRMRMRTMDKAAERGEEAGEVGRSQMREFTLGPEGFGCFSFGCSIWCQ